MRRRLPVVAALCLAACLAGCSQTTPAPPATSAVDEHPRAREARELLAAAKACRNWQGRQVGNLMMESTLGSAVNLIDLPGPGGAVAGNVAGQVYNAAMDRKWEAERQAAERDCERVGELADKLED